MEGATREWRPRGGGLIVLPIFIKLGLPQKLWVEEGNMPYSSSLKDLLNN